mmetsp:Transcript_942/g.2002  ORF Transcript_942/g.2002 Transcript_942/m.2002 type:complete len:663 (+) Transcript_942:133-2121(+)
MGKRKTAKTGDKALYNSREQLANQSGKKQNDNDDPMYDDVDRFHNERDQDFIRLNEEDRRNSDDEDEDLAGNTHSVLDLGAGGTSSEEEEDDDSSDEERAYIDKKTEKYSSAEESSSSDDDDDDEEMAEEDPRNWGKKKSLYYHGDTADLEIGQEEEDAYLEEEAAQEIQKSRFEEMDEDDFMLSGDEDESSSKKNDNQASGVSKTKSEELQTVRDTSNLSKRETRKLLDKHFPELLPMTSYFSEVVKDLKDRTEIATNLLMESEETAESVGATIKGRQYLITKAMIQKSIALNGIMYLLLRCASVGDEDATSAIQTHPVIDHVKKLTNLLTNLENSVKAKAKDIDSQLDNLVKAGALMANLGGEDGSQIVSSDGDNISESSIEENEKQIENNSSSVDADDSSEDSAEETDQDTREALAQKKQRDSGRTLNEARFGLRPSEVKNSSSASRKRRSHDLDDFGDLEEEDKLSGNVLASTINTIEQRSKTASRKRRPAPVVEELDEYDEYDDRLAQGLKMMEEEMGKLDDEVEKDSDVEEMDADNMSDPDADDDALGFYNQIANKSKKKKSFKKSLYKVAPKFPRVDGEVAGERSISRVILKNRGLVAHKAKINRNPRVKKREQYRKALIRRKGTVREVRDAAEGNEYGGEQTGIKTRISRSRKL